LATNAACAALLAAEVIGSLGMWVALPVAWIWIAARVFEATESLAVAGGAALVGLAAFESLTVKALARVDGVWIQLRRRAGREQADRALARRKRSATNGRSGSDGPGQLRLARLLERRARPSPRQRRRPPDALVELEHERRYEHGAHQEGVEQHAEGDHEAD